MSLYPEDRRRTPGPGISDTAELLKKVLYIPRTKIDLWRELSQCTTTSIEKALSKLYREGIIDKGEGIYRRYWLI